MSKKFIVKNRKDEFVVISLRIPKTIRDDFDKLAGKSGYSRNELMCMGLQYALDNLEFIPEDKKE